MVENGAGAGVPGVNLVSQRRGGVAPENAVVQCGSGSAADIEASAIAARRIIVGYCAVGYCWSGSTVEVNSTPSARAIVCYCAVDDRGITVLVAFNAASNGGRSIIFYYAPVYCGIGPCRNVDAAGNITCSVVEYSAVGN